MQLSYRGIHYNYNPVEVPVQATGLTGKYRGAAVQVRQAIAKANSSQPALTLMYRGVAYGNSAAQAQNHAVKRNPFQLRYRGIPYSNQAELANSEQEPITQTIRQLAMQRRIQEETRELAVLKRFGEAIAVPVTTNSNPHHAAMS